MKFATGLLGLLVSTFHLALSIPTLKSLNRDVEVATTAKRGVDTTAKRNIIFVQTFHDTAGNPLSLLPLLDEETGVTHVILASVHLNDDPHDIHLNNYPPSDDMFKQTWEEVKVLQANGIKVMALLGGWGDGSWNHLTSDYEGYYRPLVDEFLKPFGLDGLDLDIESSQPLSLPLQLLQDLYSDMGPDFILTLAPVASALANDNGGLSGFSYFQLDASAVAPDTNEKLISWYNAQFYSGFGSPASPSYYNSIIGRGWDPNRIVLGVLVNPNDGSGWYPLTTYQNTISQLVATYDNFGGVFGWEYWDAGAQDGLQYPWQWVKAIGVSLGQATASVLKASANLIGKDVPYDELPFPDSPFPAASLERLTSKGADHYEALRALNYTSGDVAEAEKILQEQLGNNSSVEL